MKNLYNWIIIIIFVFILGQCVITQKRYNTLQENYNELLFERSNVVDSLERDNKEKIESIVILESEIVSLNQEIDTLLLIKKEIKENKKNFEISKNISEGSKLLKQNLHEKNISNHT